jgi:predicted ribosome quality control (RQC) complex YloA/Tae2 family protein
LIFAEIDEIANKLKALVGAQLQEAWLSGLQVGLGFYDQGRIEWLWVDLHPREPMVLLLPSVPRTAKRETKPVLLFIKSHLVGQRLRDVQIDFQKGRMLWLVFAAGKIEIRLFAKGQNFIVEAAGKMVSFDKIKDVISQESEFNEAVTTSLEVRSWSQITGEWLQKNNSVLRASQDPQSAQVLAEKKWKKETEKKETALLKIKEDYEIKTDQRWRQAGDWLKGEGAYLFPEEIPAEFLGLLDLEQKLSFNIEKVFKKAKDNDRRLAGSLERRQQIEKELEELKARGPQLPSSSSSPKTKQKSLMERAAARGRRLAVADNVDAFIGKSAADNLALLRRAQPFDYWLHLRDYPGSHAILKRTRSRIITDAEFAVVARWVVQQSLGKSAADLKGDKFDLVIVECRFVRPIKGDRLGRVHYTHDRILTIRM